MSPCFSRVSMNREQVDVKALVSLEYEGRAYRPGEWFRALVVDALTMGQAGRVSLNREYATKAPTAAAAVTTSDNKPSRRSYKRRDLTAESS